MKENWIWIEKLEILKKIIDQKIVDIKNNNSNHSSNEEILFWEIIDRFFQLYLFKKDSLSYQFDNNSDTKTQIKNIISVKFAWFFNKLWTQAEQINDILKELILDTVLQFNNWNKLNWLDFIFPLDEFIILDTNNNEILYWATLWKQIDFDKNSVWFFLDRISLIEIWETIQAWSQMWQANDMAIKIAKDKILLLNNTAFSINQLIEHWNWSWMKNSLHSHINKIIEIFK